MAIVIAFAVFALEFLGIVALGEGETPTAMSGACAVRYDHPDRWVAISWPTRRSTSECGHYETVAARI